MIIYNPTDKPIEFRYGGAVEIIRPNESVTMSDAKGKYVLDPRKTKGLVKYSDVPHVEEEIGDTDYVNMPWRELIKRASARGLFRPGMKKEQVIEIMEDYDGARGTIQKPSD